MNYKITTSIQWILVFGAGVAALHFGKAYSRARAREFAPQYANATTREDISAAINAHNEATDREQ